MAKYQLFKLGKKPKTTLAKPTHVPKDKLPGDLKEMGPEVVQLSGPADEVVSATDGESYYINTTTNVPDGEYYMIEVDNEAGKSFIHADLGNHSRGIIFKNEEDAALAADLAYDEVTEQNNWKIYAVKIKNRLITSIYLYMD
jgi:hypothetical protein